MEINEIVEKLEKEMIKLQTENTNLLTSLSSLATELMSVKTKLNNKWWIACPHCYTAFEYTIDSLEHIQQHKGAK